MSKAQEAHVSHTHQDEASRLKAHGIPSLGSYELHDEPKETNVPSPLTAKEDNLRPQYPRPILARPHAPYTVPLSNSNSKNATGSPRSLAAGERRVLGEAATSTPAGVPCS